MVATVVHHKAPAIAAGMPVDVICAGMYRACSTWQYEVVAHLLERHRSGRRLGYLTAEEYARESRVDVQCRPRKRPAVGDWRVFKSHDADGCFSRAIGQGRAVVVYAYRDVRDVVFSLMHSAADLRAVAPPGDDPPGAGQRPLLDEAAGCPHQRCDRILADRWRRFAELAHRLGVDPADGEAERTRRSSLASNKARTEALPPARTGGRRSQGSVKRPDLRFLDPVALEPRARRQLRLLVRRVNARAEDRPRQAVWPLADGTRLRVAAGACRSGSGRAAASLAAREATA